MILIFSNETDLDVLSADFEAIMLRTKSKSRESDETIYWSYEDIVDFVNRIMDYYLSMQERKAMG